MRWLYHVLAADEELDEPYAPPSLAREGFIHCSFQPEVRESARRWFTPDRPLAVLQIDPRRLDAHVELADTPRGPMPHVRGAIPADAIRDEIALDDIDAAPDRVTGTRIGLAAFEDMTLLDLVGALDPMSRIASMGFDPTSSCEVFSLGGKQRVWAGSQAELRALRVRPDLGEFDVVVLPGGQGARRLCEDPVVVEWLRAYPPNRLIASVCTGALLVGAAGRLAGKRATTHASALPLLSRYGATPVAERVVDAGQVVTAGGVTASIDLGLHLVRRLEGPEVAQRIAIQMEWRNT